jgi:hypothetical protein
VIKNVIGAPSQALQIIFRMQGQKTSQNRAVKKVHFFKLQYEFFFILTSPTFKPHNFFKKLFILINLK